VIADLQRCDAIDYIRTMGSGSADLIILDPDYQDWTRLIAAGLLQESMRVLKDTGSILCFTKQPFDFNLRVAVNQWFRREIVWTFTNGGAWVSNKMPLVSTQKIYWLTKGGDFYFNPRTGLSYSAGTKEFKRSSKVFEGYAAEGKDFKKDPDGTWIRDHLHFNKPRCGNIPAKPAELIKILIRCFCPEDGVIFDPFAGSGVVEIITKDDKHKTIGTEIDEDRFNVIAEKIRGRGGNATNRRG